MYKKEVNELLNFTKQNKYSIFKKKCGKFKEILTYDVFYYICKYGQHACSELQMEHNSIKRNNFNISLKFLKQPFYYKNNRENNL